MKGRDVGRRRHIHRQHAAVGVEQWQSQWFQWPDSAHHQLQMLGKAAHQSFSNSPEATKSRNHARNSGPRSSRPLASRTVACR